MKRRKSETTKSLYVILSRTNTGFAKALRVFGNLQYNHASLAFNEDLNPMYSFARTQKYGWLAGGLTKETTDRFLSDDHDINIAVIKLDVSEEKYNRIYNEVMEIEKDPQYRYNFFSVLTYPFLGGFSIYKAYSCVEFVMNMLNDLGDYSFNRPLPNYTPDELYDIFREAIYYEGSMKEFVGGRMDSSDYFTHFNLHLAKENAVGLATISKRSLGTFKRWAVGRYLYYAD